MKVAVLIPGELRDVHNVKNLYEDCDVFIHSDKKYLDDVRYKMNRAYPIRWSFESFEGDDERRYEKYIENFSYNMHRIVQWYRYTKLLEKNFFKFFTYKHPYKKINFFYQFYSPIFVLIQKDL